MGLSVVVAGSLVEIVELGLFEGQIGIVIDEDVSWGGGETFFNILIQEGVFPFLIIYIRVIDENG